MFPLLSIALAIHSLGGARVPAGTALHVRLSTAAGSFASRPGATIQATLISPVKSGGDTIFPAGSLVSGSVSKVRRVGLGLLHETASLELAFDSISTPDAATITLPAKLASVDTGREEVLPSGAIHEVRVTGSVANRAAHWVRKLALIDVHAVAAVWFVKSVVMQASEPEIYLPPGTELTLNLTKPLVGIPTGGLDEPLSLSPEEIAELSAASEASPARTASPSNKRPSDVVNLMLIGSRREVESAFFAAGWSRARDWSSHNNVAGAFAVATGRSFKDAPMTKLTLDDAPADMTWQKGFNDVSKRHHVRLWRAPFTWHGQDVWLAAGTRDVDFTYLRNGKLITHSVGRGVDLERSKIVDDLAFTSCVDRTGSISRPYLAGSLKNATGEKFDTDGGLAVVQLNSCLDTRTVAASGEVLPIHGKAWQLVVRREVLSFRSDLIRHNPYWRGYEGLRALVSAARRKQPTDPDQAPTATAMSRLRESKLGTFVALR